MWVKGTALPSQRLVVSSIRGNDSKCVNSTTVPCRSLNVALAKARRSFGFGFLDLVIEPGEYVESQPVALSGKNMQVRISGDSFANLTCSSLQPTSQNCLIIGSNLRLLAGSVRVRGSVQISQERMTSLSFGGQNTTRAGVSILEVTPLATGSALAGGTMIIFNSTVDASTMRFRVNINSLVPSSWKRYPDSIVSVADSSMVLDTLEFQEQQQTSCASYSVKFDNFLLVTLSIVSSASCGMTMEDSFLQVRNISISGVARQSGAALHVVNTSLQLERLDVSNCYTENSDCGGVNLITSSSLTLSQSLRLVSNVAAKGQGGGGCVLGSSSLVFDGDELLIFNNQARSGAGGIFVAGQSKLSVKAASCHFDSNSAGVSGGAVILSSSSQGIFTGCLFSNNRVQGGKISFVCFS